MLPSNQRHIEESCLHDRGYQAKTGHAGKQEQGCADCLLLNLLGLTTAVGSSNGDNRSHSEVSLSGTPEETFSSSVSTCSLMYSGNHHTNVNHNSIKTGVLVLRTTY